MGAKDLLDRFFPQDSIGIPLYPHRHKLGRAVFFLEVFV
jgi:hypothetical protein